MNPARPPDETEPLTPEQEATARAAGLWVNQFARTLKTCRLYDGNNPTVVRFRADLHVATARLVEQHGAVQLRFTADDVTCEGESLYAARSREDNLALPFYRDGVRGLTLTRGIEARECDVLVDALLQVTGQNFSEDDLVTLLWEAALAHVEIDYVPSEGEVGAGGPSGTAEGAGPLLPWPTAGGEESGDGGPSMTAAAPDGAAVEPESPAGHLSRSDDWNAGDLTVEIEAGYEELEALSASEVKRFQAEFAAEHDVGIVTATVAIAHAYLKSGISEDDRAELARFLPRVLRQAISHAGWLEAREALLLLRECKSREWNAETFAQELLQPISVAGAVEKLDAQPDDAVQNFIALARELGEPGVDWLNLVLAESQVRKNRRALAEAIAQLCRDRPERLAPWIADPRWYVVRNVVHILGWIGGPQIVGLLQVALRNPEPRVRQEVIAALGQVELRYARPLLIKLLDGGDSRQFCGVLHMLSAARDVATTRLLMGFLQAPEFENRPLDERQAIYSALGSTAGDAAVAELEAELHKGNWLSRNQEAHRAAIARVIARIGTPQARLVLERGIQSKRVLVRKACEDALGGMRDAA